MNSSILEARETRIHLIHQIISKNDRNVISIKANTPGKNKNTKESYLLVKLFKNIIHPMVTIRSIQLIEGFDGPSFLIEVNEKDTILLKNILVEIEESHELGRFIDLDLYKDTNKSISRFDLNIAPRKCFLCETDAVICSRTQSHLVDEISQYIEISIRKYLLKQIEKFLDEAMTKELELEYKFGLVTKTSQGSHPDMDYSRMVKGKNAIIPYLVQMFELGFYCESLTEIHNKGRIVGIKAEESMNDATNGINCYKGLIFLSGLALLSLGYTMQTHNDFDDLFSFVQKMTKDLLKEFNQEPLTSGMRVYRQYHITGVRGEAHQGLSSIRHGLSIIENLDTVSDQDLRGLLIQLILKSEDTVFLKRAGSMEKYNLVKEMLSKIDVTNFEQIVHFNNYAIKENLSFGGAADLLVTTLLLHKVKKDFF